MANELKTATVQSILALHQKRWSHRRIARELGIDRGTVARYVRLAAEAAEAERCSARAGGETAGSKPADAPIGANSKPADAPIGASPGGEHFEPAITPMGSEGSASQPAASSLLPGRQSDCEPWREVIRAKCEQGLSAKRIHQDLVGDLGARVSYDSVRRFLRRLGRTRPLPFRRMECEPGEEAQVDFGKGAPVLMPGAAGGVGRICSAWCSATAARRTARRAGGRRPRTSFAAWRTPSGIVAAARRCW